MCPEPDREWSQSAPVTAGKAGVQLPAMAFRPMPLSHRSLRKQIAGALENPVGVVRRLWKKDDALATMSATMATYHEAVDKFTRFATAFMEHERVLTQTRRQSQLREKEIELARLRKEIGALKLVIPLLFEELGACQIEYVSGGNADSVPCGRVAVAECADCGVPICSECRTECCEDSFCGQCYDYHATNSCMKKPVQSERQSPPTEVPKSPTFFFSVLTFDP